MQAPVLFPEAESATTAETSTSASALAHPRPTSPGRLRLLALALASGILLWLCHFPVAWGWLGWIALVPLLPLVRADIRARWRYFCAWLAGTVYFWPAISWMTVADTRMVASWAVLSFYCSLYFPVGIFIVRRFQRGAGWPLLLTFPVVWTALEFFRSYFGTGFSWYLLAHTQHDALTVIQIADLGGAFAVTFLVAAVNAIIFEGLTRLAPVRHWLRLPETQATTCCRNFTLQLGCVALMLGVTLAYGGWQLSQDDGEAGPRIALLQGNIDQRLRIDAHRSAASQARVRAIYRDLCLQAAKLDPPPQLIVWPETSCPEPWVTVAPDIDVSKLPENFRNKLALEQNLVLYFGLSTRTNVLLGLNTEVLDHTKTRRYNSALLVDRRGEPVQRYDKIHRVPFGEYVPFRDWLPFMNTFSPYDFDYSIGQGDGLTRFPLGQTTFGVLVCYEDTDQSMARNYGIATSDGPPVDFLLNISNDGWFNGSSEHEEHLAISRFRAIETRRALARSVNMGISALIDSSGRVLAPEKHKSKIEGQCDVWTLSTGQSLPLGQWHEFKQTEGILVFDVPIGSRTSLYAVGGDWLPYGCWAVIGGGLFWGSRRRQTHGVGLPSQAVIATMDGLERPSY